MERPPVLLTRLVRQWPCAGANSDETSRGFPESGLTEGCGRKDHPLPHALKGITKQGRVGVERTDGLAWDNLSSSIRTVTVGSGITPDLQTPDQSVIGKSARGLAVEAYRRWGISPRPENKVGALDSSSFSLSMGF